MIINGPTGQICQQILSGSDSHVQLEPTLDAMRATMDENVQKGPRLAFTDNPNDDKNFLLDKLPSLCQMQAELEMAQPVPQAFRHDQLEPTLDAMRATMDEYGQKGPRLAFTDNPSEDKNFLLGKLPFLHQT